jgi:AraC-like DNA-binding protein/predicted ester cyclase
MTGGFGGEGVRRFYSEHFVNQIPKDVTVTAISRTVGKDQVVDELIVSFTHDTQWDYLLPGLPPTGKRVKLPHVVVMKFENGKVAHEHIYWDQASLLVQVGLLDPANLPVAGVEQARRYRGGLGPARLRRVKEFVHVNMEDELRLSELAQSVGLSSAHFSEMFRKSTGETPHQFVLRLRVERAKEMLRSAESRVLDVAIACGFKTQQHFARVFRQLCGSTPTEYRRELPGHVLPRASETCFEEHGQQVAIDGNSFRIAGHLPRTATETVR